MQASFATSTRDLRIAIIGGGPGGLTLARTLLIHGITATVFELDESSLARPQGGTLDLHVESGQLALRRAGLEKEFLSVARYEDQGARLYDKEGRLRFEEAEGADRDRPEVDRTELRRILLESLPTDQVLWNYKLKSVTRAAGGGWEVSFENGVRGVFDLVVGADGAWSRVRPLVSDAVPEYLGITFIEFGIDQFDRDHPEIAALVGRGKIFALGDSKALIAQRNANSHLRIYAALHLPEDWKSSGLDLSSAATAKACLTEHFKDWAPKLLELIRNGGDWFVSRGLYALPPGHRWRHVEGITLLGDAAHLMSPFGGEGVNLAMLDASELALAIAAGEEGGIARYEQEMCDRAMQPAIGAMEALQATLSEKGLEHSLEHFEQVMGPGIDDSNRQRNSAAS